MKLYRSLEEDGWASIEGPEDDWQPDPETWRPASMREYLWWELTHPVFAWWQVIAFFIIWAVLTWVFS